MTKEDKQIVTLKIDDREDSKIANIIDTKKFKEFSDNLKIQIESEICRNIIGDYIVEDKNLCFERKTIFDFIGSVRDKRLFAQILNMENNFENCFLLISGNIKDVTFNPHYSNYTVNEFVGSISSIIARTNTKVFMVNNDTQLLKLMFKIIEKTVVNKELSIITRIKKTREDIQMMMLMCIPGIGEDKAKEILRAYEFNELPSKTVSDLKEISGIGERTAKNILDVISKR